MRLHRNSLLVLALLGTTALAGCGHGPVIGGIQLPSQQEVIDAFKTACQFEPDAATVANIIGALAGVGPITGGLTALAAQGCAALAQSGLTASTPKGRFGAVRAPITFKVGNKNVALHGHFVPAQ